MIMENTVVSEEQVKNFIEACKQGKSIIYQMENHRSLRNSLQKLDDYHLLAERTMEATKTEVRDLDHLLLRNATRNSLVREFSVTMLSPSPSIRWVEDVIV
ncbi:uncharacterized protein G2W53_021740 [Senna tora]|uniref:Uncharacterized protein n=1 Tax=Senna tora TaxID=362788 RepID=A0A834WLE2_9FABA|nr:uncharacterized protein G2W53_021740 [Senna tora]